jgi:hypothetical protein
MFGAESRLSGEQGGRRSGYQGSRFSQAMAENREKAGKSLARWLTKKA